MNQALLDRQAALELDMRSIGTARFEKMIADARAGKRESETPYGSVLLDEAVLPMSVLVRKWLKDHEKPMGSSTHTSIPYLVVINNPELAAFQTCKAVLDCLSMMKEPLALALKIGGSLEDEVRMREFENKNKAYYRTLKRSLDKRSDHSGYRRKVLVFSMNKAGIHWSGWPKEDKVHLGMKLIELFIEATGFISLDHTEKKKRSNPLVILPSPAVLNWVKKKNASGSVMQPELLPMLVPPRDWTTPWDGGYLTKAVPQMSMVKVRSRMYLEDLAALEIPKVYKAINGLQRTAWQVNAEVLMVFRELWNSGVAVGDTPPKSMVEEPPKPHDIDTNPEAKRVWKWALTKAKTENIRRTSKILQTAKILSIADKFQDEAAIYFPHQMDFRGRMYAVPMFLNPQGPDHAKALLRFAEGKPLGDQVAVDWLAVHGANCFGVDKVSYEDRITWVVENEDQIIQSAENPLDHLWWTKADAPWQFLAFCFEWYGFSQCGFDWVSKIPVALDGSCNGLQHFSAMLRDEVGGASVNLIPSDKPSDIYQTVADHVIERLALDMSSQAMFWKQTGVNRKLTKRCVMTRPYGATAYGYKMFIYDHLANLRGDSAMAYGVSEGDLYYIRNQKNHAPIPLKKEVSNVTFMATEIHGAIGRTVVKAEEAMKWLQDISRIASDGGLPMQWTTPSGFPVVQGYQKYKSKQIEISLSGKRYGLRMQSEIPKIDRKRQSQGISPNFVHSLDASALMETLGDSLDQGITSFAMIHDSYGTHAADTAALADSLRTSFVGLYATRNVLEDFRLSVAEHNGIPLSKIPLTPSFGKLEIQGVLRSKYFFA